MARVRPSRWDGEIAALAIPAVATLATEPAYLLTDTAIVGTLGRVPLAALAPANTVVLAGYSVFIFLTFATTAAVARLLGAGRSEQADEESVNAMWLGEALGSMAALVVAPIAEPIVGLFGTTSAVTSGATTYLRISTLGFPAVLVVMAGAGIRRGHSDTRTPMWVAGGTVVVNLVVEAVAIFGLGFGLGASAASTVVAQWVGAAVFLVVVGRDVSGRGGTLRPRPARMLRQLRVGSALIVRTIALRSLFVMAVALVARHGTTQLAAYQIGIGLWTFLAFAYDGIETAGQTLVARELGAGNPATARGAADRVVTWAMVASGVLGVVTVLGHRVVAEWFTSDPATAASAAAALLWVGAGQPLGGLSFSLDGVLVGAGDLGYLARAMIEVATFFAAGALLAVVTDAGPWSVWAVLTCAMALRALLMTRRYRSGHWVRTGVRPVGG